MTRQIREPLAFPMPDNDTWACTSCVVGNLLYMYGLKDHIKIPEIDRLTGRRKGDPGSGFFWDIGLRKAGLNLTLVSDFDASKAMGTNGLEYFQQYDKSHNVSPIMDAKRYKLWVTNVKEAAKLAKNAKGTCIEVVKNPTPAALIKLAKQMPVVVSLKVEGWEIHLILIYGVFNGEMLNIYNPSPKRHKQLQLYSENVYDIWEDMEDSKSLCGVSR